jgi:hypothetical protein
VLLYEFNLHVAPVADGGRHVDARRLTSEPNVLKLNMLEQVEGAYPHLPRPMFDRRVQVIDDERVLHHRSDESLHELDRLYDCGFDCSRGDDGSDLAFAPVAIADGAAKLTLQDLIGESRS